MVVMCIWQRPDKTDAFSREQWRKESSDNFNLQHLMHIVLCDHMQEAWLYREYLIMNTHLKENKTCTLDSTVCQYCCVTSFILPYLPFSFYLTILLVCCCMDFHCFSPHHNTINKDGFKTVFDSAIRVCKNCRINNSTLLPAWITCTSPL